MRKSSAFTCAFRRFSCNASCARKEEAILHTREYAYYIYVSGENSERPVVIDDDCIVSACVGWINSLECVAKYMPDCSPSRYGVAKLAYV